MLQDRLLILRFKQHSPDALRRIYEKYRLYLLKISAALLHDVSAAEDVVHDVFVKFAGSGESLKATGSLKAYLRTCVVNTARNHARANSIRSAATLDEVDDIAGSPDSPDQWVVLDEQSARISKALARIPLEQREVIVQHIQGQATFREIAASNKMPIKTVQSRYRYGLDKLRVLLNSEAPK